MISSIINKMASSNLRITLSPITVSDCAIAARIEHAAHEDDEWAAATFGPLRSSDEAIAKRATSIASDPSAGEELRNMKAVAVGPEGEEIVGFASWAFCEGREASSKEVAKDGEAKKKEEEEIMLGPGANVKLFKESILRGDEHMERATGGRDYAST
jgi:hypothetical protein